MYGRAHGAHHNGVFPQALGQRQHNVPECFGNAARLRPNVKDLHIPFMLSDNAVAGRQKSLKFL